MTATQATDDDGEEPTDQITADMAAIITSRAVLIAEEFHSRALDAEESAEQGDPEALEEIAEAIAEASDEIAALEELAQRADSQSRHTN